LAPGDVRNSATTTEERQHMDSLTGKTIRWRFADEPVAGTAFEHVFHDDGSVTWRIVEGENKGATAREPSYTAMRVNEQTWVVSYLAASGHTLTVALDIAGGQAFGFASNEKSSSSFRGTFEWVE
jgi:hypothetical protein